MKIFSHSFNIQFLSYCYQFCLSFITSIAFVRAAEPELYGKFIYLFSCLGLIAIFIHLGVQNSILTKRKISLTKSTYANAVKTGITQISVSVSVVLTFIMIVFSNFWLQSSDTFELVAIACFLIGQSNEIPKSFLIRNANFKKIAQIEIALITLTTVLKIIFIIQSRFDFYISVHAFEVMAKLICFTFLSKIKLNEILPWKLYKDLYQNYLLPSVPILVSGLFVVGINKTDVIMIKHFLGETEVASYAIATRFSVIVNVLPGFLILSQISSLQRTLKFSDIKRIYKQTLILALSASVFIVLASPILLPVIFGKFYEASSSLAQVYAASIPFAFLIIIDNKLRSKLRWNSSIFHLTSRGFLLNFLLNTIMIPTIGVAGSILASITSIIYMSVLYDLFSNNKKAKFLTAGKMYAFNG